MRPRGRLGVIACAAALAACGPWQRVGAPERPGPGVATATLFDPVARYRAMGFLAAGAPLPFVGTLHWLAGPTPDSTLGVLALSFANHALAFQRDGNQFVASYRVEAAFRPDTGVPRLVASDQTVRVGSFKETLRADESIIYQNSTLLAPGVYSVDVTVRDRNGSALSRASVVDTVPRFGAAGLAAPIAIYEGSGRRARDSIPRFYLNPRATEPYGADTLRFYVEAYGVAGGAPIVGAALDEHGVLLWTDTVPLRGDGALGAALFTLPPDRLPAGSDRFVATRPGSADTAVAPFLVSFSGQYVVTNWNEMVSLLRYFPREDLVSRLRSAPDSARAQAWHDFWVASDPVPVTPENEALDEYFGRIEVANERYSNEGDPGWLTDRGEVFIALGDPDEAYDLQSEYTRTGVHVLRWIYTDLRLDLYFVDQSGFGRFRLTPSSRADFENVRARLRRSQ